MARLARALILAVLFAAVPATTVFAQLSAQQSAELDTLFASLHGATDEAQARAIGDQIWQLWTHPDDAELAARVDAIIKGGGFAGPVAQLPQIDELVADYPGYAEAYNLRATANFLRGDYESALRDVEKTLELEPRHFGALAGRALIFHTQGKYEEAKAALLEGLEIHPFLPERSLFPELGPPPIRS
ncbi:tetratricopeptide repeat protein [Devosia rhizoryzae]|uniref:Tetratricopeptide repeat protein n=1 Tax=Devosia rhizoryzae TaxID=2774137 RepID=A0ABX7C5H0_9HYPH|nr:tetratricopeptide repeat protein [Devosia rhizoryzae]QQR39498.1 tetratricopeptide repeat protein [Devosia rhizoryzae]